MVEGFPHGEPRLFSARIHSGRRHIPAQIAQEIALHSVDDPRSNRELTVLGLIAEGMANKEISRALHISEQTVKAHLKSIFSKLDVDDRTHAVMTAIRRGIIQA